MARQLRPANRRQESSMLLLRVSDLHFLQYQERCRPPPPGPQQSGTRESSQCYPTIVSASGSIQGDSAIQYGTCPDSDGRGCMPSGFGKDYIPPVLMSAALLRLLRESYATCHELILYPEKGDLYLPGTPPSPAHGDRDLWSSDVLFISPWSINDGVADSVSLSIDE